MSDFKRFKYIDLEHIIDEAFRPLREPFERFSERLAPEDKVILPNPPDDSAMAGLIRHPTVIVIVGHRDSGKSSLAVRIQELEQDIAPPYAVGLPSTAARLLPSWYGLTDNLLDLTSNAIIYIPESCCSMPGPLKLPREWP